MRQIFGILLILGALYVCLQLYSKYETIRKESRLGQQSQEEAKASPAPLTGMHPSLEPALQAAKQKGAGGLADFLKQYRYAINDPKLADIELDYVLLLSLRDPAEARRVFKNVRQRTPNTSPVYPRIQKLEKTFQ